jgi:uncharacterized membrane protein
MTKNRLEAFSDGVLAIIITIMVLELKVPHDPSLKALQPLVPVFFSYLLSFIYVAIYWNNHHHMMHATGRVNGPILWANMHLLFWLSVVPFATGWLGENHFAPVPAALYGTVLLMSGVAYWILQSTIIASEGKDSVLSQAVGRDLKGKGSVVLYILAVMSCALSHWIAMAIYAGVAMMWLIPDRRIERAIAVAEDERE